MTRRILAKGLTVFLVLLFAFSAEAENQSKESDEQEMIITGLGLDKRAGAPVVLLADKERKKVLPIWVGLCEARSIELGLSSEIASRPLTYDMFAAIVRTMKAKVERIVITDLRDNVFFAQVEVSVNGAISKIDARPSDAIALASRMKAPIYVKKSVLEKGITPDTKVEKRGT